MHEAAAEHQPLSIAGLAVCDGDGVPVQLRPHPSSEGLSWVCPLAELAKAKKQRQQTAKQEAIATGMHQLKALGKGRKGGKGNGKARQKKLKG